MLGSQACGIRSGFYESFFVGLVKLQFGEKTTHNLTQSRLSCRSSPPIFCGLAESSHMSEINSGLHYAAQSSLFSIVEIHSVFAVLSFVDSASQPRWKIKASGRK